MNGILGYNSFLGRLINKTVDYLFLFFLWVVFSIPVITIGASTCAFYYTFHKSLMLDRGYILRSFIKSFKENFKQATAVFVIQVIVWALVALNVYYLYVLRESFNSIISWIILVIAVLAILWTMYWFPYIAFFEDKTKTVIKNCRYLMFSNMPWTLTLIVLAVFMVFLMYQYSVGFLVVLIIYMALCGWIFHLIYKKHMPEDLVKDPMEEELAELPEEQLEQSEGQSEQQED